MLSHNTACHHIKHYCIVDVVIVFINFQVIMIIELFAIYNTGETPFVLFT